jgi:hypothetical protein
LPDTDVEEDLLDWEVRVLPDDDAANETRRPREPHGRRRLKPYVAARRARGGDAANGKTIRTGARSVIKPRKRR